MKYKTVDPCQLTSEWLVVYGNEVFPITRIDRDDHKAPYCVLFGRSKYFSIEFLMKSRAVVWEPVMDKDFARGYALLTSSLDAPERKRWESVIGWHPAKLKWNADPRKIKKLLPPKKKGQLIGAKEKISDEWYKAVVGKYLGEYEYSEWGSVLAKADPIFCISDKPEPKIASRGWHQTYPIRRAPHEYYNFIRKLMEPDPYKGFLEIPSLEDLLPTTKQTLEFVRSLSNNSPEFDEAMKFLEEAIKIN